MHTESLSDKACTFLIDTDDLPRLIPNSEKENGMELANIVVSDDDDDDDAGDGSDDDWTEMEQDNDPTRCLFCDSIQDSIELAIRHLGTEHNFDLNVIKEKFNMDQYSYIKVNIVSLLHRTFD